MNAENRSVSPSEALRFRAAHRWILSVSLLVLQTNCLTSSGLPAPLSPPECFMPCDEKSCSVDIHCTWEGGEWESQFPANYILHWKTNNGNGNISSSNSLKAVIQREDFPNHEDLSVWVEVQNQHGSVKSKENVFNAADIIKPPPPQVTPTLQDPPEIEWISFCDKFDLSAGPCDVLYRVKTDLIWSEHKDIRHQSFGLDSYQPGTVYAFQVRCACRNTLMSDWSEVHEVRSAEKSPVGELDIWMDCSPTGDVDCTLTWKELPLSLARGVIVAYRVVLFYRNGTVNLLNLSTADSKGLLMCSERQCYFNCSLKDVASVDVLASNAHGATEPSCLKMPTFGLPGQEKNDRVVNLIVTEQNLTVSWDLPTQQAQNLREDEEYVVQYKQEGSAPGLGFDWVKVNRSQNVVFFTGYFQNYTPYRVSLFTVSPGKEVCFLSSNIGFSCEGTPPKVQSLKVLSIADTQVTLFWESDPLYKQRGLVQYYQVGTDNVNVYNVSTSPLKLNETFVLKSLRPNQDYEVWIRAVTKAGPGAKNTATFKTEHKGINVVLLLILTSTFLVLSGIFILIGCLKSEKAQWFCEKVPDPSNSLICKHIKVIDGLAPIFIPVREQHPSISVLEVVFSGDFCSNGQDKSSCIDSQDEQRLVSDRTEHRGRREEYSKMIDSDEERPLEEDKGDSWSSSEGEFTSGYEKHFMPTVEDILEG